MNPTRSSQQNRQHRNKVIVASLPSGPHLCPCLVSVVQSSVGDKVKLLLAPVCCGWVKGHSAMIHIHRNTYRESWRERNPWPDTEPSQKWRLLFRLETVCNLLETHSEPGSQSFASSRIARASSELTFTLGTLKPRSSYHAHDPTAQLFYFPSLLGLLF